MCKSKTQLIFILLLAAIITAPAVLVLAAIHVAPAALASVETDREYKIKAIYLYNFAKFTEWPMDHNASIIIGIIGEDPFTGALNPAEMGKVKGREVEIKRFKSLEEIQENGNEESLRQCHLLFVSSSEEKDRDSILKAIDGSNVLSVAEMDGFLEAGGIIRFLIEDQKVIFELNLISLEKAKLSISSKIIRIAKRVIGDEK